jgi:hypothetical protein
MMRLKELGTIMNYRAVILQVGSSCILLTTSLAAQKETFVPANDVSFTISTETSRYKAGEQITLKYRITNVSNAPLNVPREWEAKCPGKPHVWAWFENGSGQHFVPGYAASCLSSTNSRADTVTERMVREAVLLEPGKSVDGTFRLDTTLFGGLKPGAYRIEAVLYCWRDEGFTAAELFELTQFGKPFLRGEVPASLPITLTL